MKRDEILTIVKKHILATLTDLKETEIDPTKSMAELGATSLDIVEIVSYSMRDLKIKISRLELVGLTNIDEFVDLLFKTKNAK
jgi:acyl carrier protein